MAEGGGNENKPLDNKIDNVNFGWDDDWDDDQHDINITQPFSVPDAASTPYHGGEQHEMQTMQHEQSGLPSYDESAPLLSTSDIERRLWDLKTNPRTGIIDTTQNGYQ